MDSLFVAGPAEFGLALRATLLIGAAWAAAAVLRTAGASAATRHVAWLLGIVALLALPLLVKNASNTARVLLRLRPTPRAIRYGR